MADRRRDAPAASAAVSGVSGVAGTKSRAMAKAAQLSGCWTGAGAVVELGAAGAEQSGPLQGGSGTAGSGDGSEGSWPWDSIEVAFPWGNCGAL
jgi:hypothetical protein